MYKRQSSPNVSLLLKLGVFLSWLTYTSILEVVFQGFCAAVYVPGFADHDNLLSNHLYFPFMVCFDVNNGS